MYFIGDAVSAVKLFLRKHNILLPKHDVDPVMQAASKGIHRFVMVRSTLIREVIDLASQHMGPQEGVPQLYTLQHQLRSFTTTNIFWAKQCLLIAAERDESEGTYLRREVSLRITATMGNTFHGLAANMRSIPERTLSRDVVKVCHHLFPWGYKGSYAVPNLVQQLEVIKQSKREGYNLGVDGVLAPLIKNHPEDYLDVLRFCIDRGIENFNADAYHQYRSIGVMREGML